MKKANVSSIMLLYFAIIVIFIPLSEALYPHTRCSLDDSPCLTEQSQKTLKEIVNGIPELGIKPMGKLPLDPIIVSIDNFAFNWTDLTVEGLKDAIIDKVSVNMDFKTMRVLFHTDLVLEFHSVLDGILFTALPVSGNGRGDLTLKNMEMEIIFVFDIIKDENGKDIMDMKTYYYGYSIAGGSAARFDNLYNGDKKKSDQLHKLVNESWRIMVNNFGVFFQRKFTNKIFDVVKIFMRSQPLEELALYSQ